MRALARRIPERLRIRRPAFLFLLGLLLLFGGVAVARTQQDHRSRDSRASKTRAPELWFFFSATDPGTAREAKRLVAFLRGRRDITLRPCLLVRDFRGLESAVKASKKLTDEIPTLIKELRSLSGPQFSLRMWDDQGLSLARELGIDRLPAYALLAPSKGSRTRRAHLAMGRDVKLEELIQCRNCR